MKKLLVSLLTLSLVFAVVASVSAAAPTVSGTIYSEVYSDKTTGGNDNNGDRVFNDIRLKVAGAIDEKTEYTVIARYTTAAKGLPGSKYVIDQKTGNVVELQDQGTAGTGEFQLREAYGTYKSEIGNFSFGKIRVNPSVVDLLDGAFGEAAGPGTLVNPAVVKYSYSFSDDTSASVAVVAADGESVKGGSAVAYLNTKVADVNLAVFVNTASKGDLGYGVNASTTFFDSLNLWAEAGQYADYAKTAKDEDLQTIYLGASYTVGKFTFELEKQFNGGAYEQWGSKIGYALTDKVAIEAFHSSNYAIGNIDADNYLKVTINF